MPRSLGHSQAGLPVRREEQLAILTEIARITHEDFELRPMLQRITDALAERFGWELVALVRLDHESRRFVCEALTSSIPTVVAPGYSRPFGSGVVGEVAITGQSLLIDDASDFEGFVEVAEATRSELCAPVRHRGEVVAVLNLESPRRAAFARDLGLVEAIADQIAGAIASARLYEATRQRALNLEVLSEVSRAAVNGGDLAAVLQSVVSYLQRRFDLLLVAIVVADAKGKNWSYRAFASRLPMTLPSRPRWPISVGIVGRAARLGRSQLVLDVSTDPDFMSVTPGVVAELAAPIRQGERILGALSLENDDPEVFTAVTRHLMELVSDQVAGAIQLALVNEQLAATQKQLQNANRSLERLSQFDPLTGVANRRHFEAVLKLEWRRLGRAQGPLSLLMLDVDYFKAYNDTLGHIAGDRCLQRLAQVLRECAQRAGDLIGRYGGEEFVLISSGADAVGALRLAERVQDCLAAAAIPHPASQVAERVTLSIGIATVVPQPGASPTSLMDAADRALYRAKVDGRNRIAVEGS